MKSNNNSTARRSKNGKFLIVTCGNQSAVLNVNLVRYLLDIPYTRKDGTHVSNAEIFEMKHNAQIAYDKKVKESAAQ